MASMNVFDVLAWGFVSFVMLLVMGVLYLWWLESRDVARRQKKPPTGERKVVQVAWVKDQAEFDRKKWRNAVAQIFKAIFGG